jgi:hypothetical protein
MRDQSRHIPDAVATEVHGFEEYLAIKPADGEGFEPSVPFWSTHAFQACPIDHSGTHPASSEPDTMRGGPANFKRRCAGSLGLASCGLDTSGAARENLPR